MFSLPQTLKVNYLKPALAGLLIASILPGLASAQGEDCASAVSITGLGDFPFDLTGFALASSGMELAGGICTPYITHGFETYYNDGVFQWTVPADGDYRFETRGNAYTGLMSIYSHAGCNTTCLGFTHEGGVNGLLIRLPGLVAGDSLLIQLGTRAAPHTGVLNIRSDYCTQFADDIYEPNNTCAEAIELTAGTHTRFYVHYNEPDYFKVSIPAGHMMQVSSLKHTTRLSVNRSFDANCENQESHNNDIVVVNSASSPQDAVFLVTKTTPSFGCGLYDLEIQFYPDPCAVETDDTFEDNDVCADPWPLTDGSYAGLWLSASDPDYYSVCIPAGSTFQATLTCDPARPPIKAYLSNPVQIDCDPGDLFFSYDQAITNAGSASLAWTNNLEMEVTVYLEFHSSVLNPWSLPLEPTCNSYDLTVSGTTSACQNWIGWPWCAPNELNSTGLPTLLHATATSPIGPGAHLESSQGPPGMFGHLFVGTGVNSPGIQVSQGRLCVAVHSSNTIGRYNIAGTAMNSLGIYDAQGRFQNLSGTSHTGYGFDMPNTVPYPGFPIVETYSYYNFQLWHREANGESNFSNALRLHF